MHRRGFLAAAGTALTAGCTSALPFGSTPTPTPTPTATPTPVPTPTATPTPVPTPTPFPFAQATNAGFSPESNPYAGGYSRSGALVLARGEYFPLSFQGSSGINLRYAFEVVEGTAIDVLVMTTDTFEEYRNRAKVLRLYADASVGGSTGHEVEIRLPAGTYVLVFDNTSFGLSKPAGSARLVYGLGFGDRS